MFANIIRTQARAALASYRTCIPTASVVAQLAARRPTQSLQSLLAISRPLSTSRPVRVDYQSEDSSYQPLRRSDPTSTLYVGNLPFSIEEAEIRERFESFGAVKAIRIAHHPDGTRRGYAHVEYAQEEDAEAAFQSFADEPLYILDRNIRVDYAPVKSRMPPREPSPKLFFQNFWSNEGELRTTLKDFESSIVQITFLKHRETRDVTGKGFIEFGNVNQATEALEQFGQPGSGLSLNYALPPKPRSNDDNRRASYGGDWGGGRRNVGGGGRDGYNGNRRGGGSGGREREGYRRGRGEDF